MNSFWVFALQRNTGFSLFLQLSKQPKAVREEKSLDYCKVKKANVDASSMLEKGYYERKQSRDDLIFHLHG